VASRAKNIQNCDLEKRSRLVYKGLNRYVI